MSFAFLGAPYLWLLPLVGLPVLFHFAWRLRRKRLRVPSLVFFQRLEPHLQSRRRLRDLLVLALRCLVVACIVLALARPAWSGFIGGSSATVAIVIDNSASMGLPGAGDAAKTRLSAALAAAGALVGELSSTDRAVVMTTVSDSLVPVLAEPTSDKAHLRAILDAIRETQAASRPGAALQAAAEVLSAATTTRREIHVLTDLQAHEWAAPALGDLHLPPSTTLWIHRLPSGYPDTEVALSALEVAARGRLAGRPIALRIGLSNGGAQAATVNLTVADDRGHRHTQSITLPAHGTQAVPVALPATSAGVHWAHVAIDGDDFALDNEGFVAFGCEAKRQVALCGTPGALGFLPLALAPAADGSLSGFTDQWFGAQQVQAAIDSHPALLVLTWDDLDALDQDQQQGLMHWLNAGGHLALCPRANGLRQTPHLPSWLGISGEVLDLQPAGEPLIALDTRDVLLHDLVEADGTVHLDAVHVLQGLALQLDPNFDWKPLLGLPDGRPILARRELGAGEIDCFGIGFTADWSSLPLSPAFLAISQALALPTAADDGILRLLAGDSPRLPGVHGGTAHLVSIAGDALDSVVPVGPAGELPAFPRSGVYAVTTSQGAHALIAIRADPGEGTREVVTGATVPALAGSPYQVADCASPQALAEAWRHGAQGFDLMPVLLILAFLAVLAEGWIANQPLVRPVAAATARNGAAA